MEVQVDDEKVEAVPELCYREDMLSAGGGCKMAAVTRCNRIWASSDSYSPFSPTTTCHF